MKENSAPDYNLTITTLFGLEEVLADEVRSIGGRNVEIQNRAVKCTGDLGFIYKCNFLLRTAIKVLKPIKRIRFRDDDSYYKALAKIDWTEIFDIDNTFSFHVSGQSPIFNNTLYAAFKAKDAVVDCFKEAHDGKRPNIDTKFANISIGIYLNNYEAEVYLNSSGDSLHRRGYHKEAGFAPLSEVLAAGIIHFTKWNGGKLFFDPMCGSGTFVIEAAMLASKLPAGVFRSDFSFTYWRDYDANLFETIRTSALKRTIEYEGKILGRDIEAEALEAARANITHAMFDDLIRTKRADFLTDDAPAETGIMVMNPPYNKKIQSQNEKLYSEIGTKLKHSYAGWEVYILTADLDSIKHIGLKPTWKKKFFNGPLEALLLRYDMFKGKHNQRFEK